MVDCFVKVYLPVGAADADDAVGAVPVRAVDGPAVEAPEAIVLLLDPAEEALVAEVTAPDIAVVDLGAEVRVDFFVVLRGFFVVVVAGHITGHDCVSSVVGGHVGAFFRLQRHLRVSVVAGCGSAKGLGWPNVKLIKV